MTQSDPVSVSIGLPVRNGATYIDTCIRSVLGQSFKDFELIISDNASTDATAEICRSYAGADSRIRYVRQETDIGAFGNFTFVLKQARAKSFMWIACDDYYESPGLVGALYERIRNGAALAFPAVKKRDLTKPGSTAVDHPEIRARLRGASSGYELARELVTSAVFPMAIYGMLNLDVLARHGIDLTAEHGMECFGDGDLLHRIIAETNRIDFVDEVFFVYCRRDGSASSSTKIERIIRDYWKYVRRIPRIYARSAFSRRERLDLALRMTPPHLRFGGVLIGSWAKRRAFRAWRAVVDRGERPR